MTTKIFIDGEHGTTGLEIYQRLKDRADIELISLEHAERHNPLLRQEASGQSDITILCLPDAAAREAAAWAKNSNTRVIDASSAHRVADNWTYGFAEMTADQSQLIKTARFVTNPGCYATGAIALLRPLREANLLTDTASLQIHGVSGYTGGGRLLIEKMETSAAPAYSSYALQGGHKHLPEIQKYGLLATKPCFTPAVGNFARGMFVSLVLDLAQLPAKPNLERLYTCYEQHYKNRQYVAVTPLEEAMQLEQLAPETWAFRDDLRIYLFPQQASSYVYLVAQLDNLGKGASGAALQNLDLMLSV